MELLSNPIVAVLLLLGVLIFVHELGHFLVGRICGIGVEIFSVGLGPIIFRYKKGGTDYRLSIIPIGGFVKFYGSVPSEEVPEGIQGTAFCEASLIARALTVFAGPFANLLMAMIVTCFIGMWGVPHPPPVVGELMADSPAERAGLQFQDIIKEINGEPIKTWSDLQRIIKDQPGQELIMGVDRKGEEVEVSVFPDVVADDNPLGNGKKGRVGISPGHIPSIVSITDPKGLGYQQGLVTGDKIVAVNDQPILYWRELLRELSQRPAERVSLSVESQKEPGAKADDKGPRKVYVDLPGSNVIEALGIDHGLLTVFSAEKPIVGLLPGDIVVSWAGHSFNGIFGFAEVVQKVQQPSVDLGIIRNGQRKEITVVLKAIDVQRIEGKRKFYTLPVKWWSTLISPEPVIERYDDIFSGLGYALNKTLEQSGQMVKGIWGLLVGKVPLQALGGPIAIAKIASDSVRMGWLTFLEYTVLININLALINLFPIPVLDGGQLVLIGVEGMYRRKLSQVAIENYQKIGFVMVLALIVIATYNDLSRFWTSMAEGIVGMLQ
ncbi:MAG: hypothetical protein CMP10_04220 [Zetaproteobacteria bacterium]|nr:hypothetical protein [Pseudobdellovibrionaceae bacterium]